MSQAKLSLKNDEKSFFKQNKMREEGILEHYIERNNNAKNRYKGK